MEQIILHGVPATSTMEEVALSIQQSSWSVETGPNATMVDNGCKTANLGQGHELGSAVDRGTAHLAVAGIPIPFRLQQPLPTGQIPALRPEFAVRQLLQIRASYINVPGQAPHLRRLWQRTPDKTPPMTSPGL